MSIATVVRILHGSRLYGTNYIRGVRVARPAVISVNMQIAAMAVNEFLARLHPYRYDPNAEFAVHRVSLIQGATYQEPDGEARPRWHVTVHADGTATLSPSVWRVRGCRSHFFVRRGLIVWCPAGLAPLYE